MKKFMVSYKGKLWPVNSVQGFAEVAADNCIAIKNMKKKLIYILLPETLTDLHLEQRSMVIRKKNLTPTYRDI